MFIMSLKLMDSFSLELTFFKRPPFLSNVITLIEQLSFLLLNRGSKILRSVQSSSKSSYSRGLSHFPVLKPKTLQYWILSGKLSNSLMQYLQPLSSELTQFSRFISPSAFIPPQLHDTAHAFCQRAL